MNRKTYPSDVNREQLDRILLLLESASKKTRPRQTGVYEVFCAILYLHKSGFHWNMLPQGFSAESRVYDYFKLWKEKLCEDKPSLLEKALKKCGWGGPYQKWTQRENDFFDR